MTKKNQNSKHPKSRASKVSASTAGPGLEGVATNVVAGEAVGALLPVLQFGLKLILVCGIGLVIVNSLKDRFIARDTRRDLDPSNISDEDAKSKADAIENAYGWFDDDFETIENALSSPSLNYNGLIKLYNAYGKRNDMTLPESIRDHFDDYEVQRLNLLTGGVLMNL